MKAITIHQPWASLIAVGAKRYETRSWQTNYRGPIAIHAGKKHAFYSFEEMDPAAKHSAIEILEESGYRWAVTDLPRGAIIAKAELIGCYKITSWCDDEHPCIFKPISWKDNERISITGNELLFGDWTPGRYAWELVDIWRPPRPIDARGAHRIWDWTPPAPEAYSKYLL